MMRLVVLYMLCVLSTLSAVGQRNSGHGFTLKGKLMDSVSSTPVNAATITVLSKNANKIIKYGISNSRGEFSLPDLSKADTTLLIQVSHLSFMPLRLERSIPNGNMLDVGSIALRSKNNQIEEVVVEMPPILMNKDTLEIYPTAFSTQPNAVVEDLLKKVPGVVVWGDGQITVNGKKVTTVLVEGKRFFGGDPVIATRNLPKDAVGKIKVYEDNEQEEWKEKNLTMDISLNNEKKDGVFGKIGAGIGNEKRKEALASVNYFNKKNQLSVFGGANNTNREAYTVRDFLKVNTYKAGSENLDAYASSFNQIGFNEFALAGTRIERSWTEDAKSDMDGLYYRKNADIVQSTQEIVDLENSKQHILSDRREARENDVFKANANHRFSDKNKDYNIAASINQTRSTSEIHSIRTAEENGVLLSRFDNHTGYKNQNNTKNIYLDYIFKDKLLRGDRGKFSYKIESSDRQTEDKQHLFYENNEKILQDVNRQKSTDWQRTKHEIYGMADIFSIVRRYQNWRLQASNFLTLDHGSEVQDDVFSDTQTIDHPIPNSGLIYRDEYQEINWTPGISLARSYHKALGRGSNRWGFRSALNYESIHRKNQSDHVGRRIENDFRSLLPSAEVNYSLNRSRGNRTFQLRYTALVNRPQLHQQVSLMDTMMKDFNYVGNPLLRSETQQQFEFKYNSISMKNSANQSLSLKYTLREDMMGDSTVYHDDGSQIRYTVNFKGRPFYAADYNYMAAMKIFGKPLNILLVSGVNGGTNNYYINDDLKEISNFNFRFSTNLTYVPMDVLTLRLGVSTNKSYVNYGSFGSNALSTGLGNDIIWNWPKRTSIINSLNIRSYRLTNIPTNTQYLWNMQVYHRFSKKEQFEIKFAMYDILRQRKNLVNTITNNSIRQQINNNLQQYFVVSFSYFPRRF